MLSASALKLNVFGSFLKWLESHLDDLDALVFDIDGVWLIDNRPMPGSLELLDKLRGETILFSFLTNDANHSTQEKSLSLKKCGLEISHEEIVSCGDGLRAFVSKHQLEDQVFFVMGDLGKPCFGEKAGLLITRKLDQLPLCKGVIISEDNYHWERVINSVVNHFIQCSETLLIVPNPDEFYPKNAGKIQIAAGGVAGFIQRILKAYGVSPEPVYLGKPHEPIFEHNHLQLEKRFGNTIDRRRVLMIGDHLKSDIWGANSFGYRSALLLSGLTNRTHVERSRIKPELLFKAL
ncbi:MAG: HAD hydrolase-like protein [Deltaproteobacteria bacterium]|nr:HAD hydrolase-like protein [Deltaproteobacteria bacterium]